MFRNFVENMQVLLNSQKNNGHFTWMGWYIYDTSLSSS